MRPESVGEGGNPVVRARLKGLILTVAYDGTQYSGLVLNENVDSEAHAATSATRC